MLIRVKLTSVFLALVALLIIDAPITSAQSLSSLNTLLSTTTGERTSIAKLGEGRVTVVVFWLTSCQPSRDELQAVNHLVDTLQGKVSFVAVAIDNAKTMAKVPSVVSARGYKFPVLLDPDKDLFNSVNGTEHPYTLIFRADGVLQTKYDGFLAGDETKLENILAGLSQANDTVPVQQH